MGVACIWNGQITCLTCDKDWYLEEYGYCSDKQRERLQEWIQIQQGISLLIVPGKMFGRNCQKWYKRWHWVKSADVYYLAEHSYARILEMCSALQWTFHWSI